MSMINCWEECVQLIASSGGCARRWHPYACVQSKKKIPLFFLDVKFEWYIEMLNLVKNAKTISKFFCENVGRWCWAPVELRDRKFYACLSSLGDELCKNHLEAWALHCPCKSSLQWPNWLSSAELFPSSSFLMLIDGLSTGCWCVQLDPVGLLQEWQYTLVERQKKSTYRKISWQFFLKRKEKMKT